MIEAFRVSSAKYAEFTGIGASLEPGRWNAAGERVVYTASSRAMAILEVFAHLGRVRPADYVIRTATIPNDVSIMLPDDHPAKLDGLKWALSDLEVSRRLGSQWLASQDSALLAVPSILDPDEFNFLINPAHPDFPRIVLGDPQPYEFDERLWKAASGPFGSRR